MSHSSDNFPDYLAWETRAGSVMGQWPQPEWDCLFIYNSCLLFKHKPGDWWDGSVGKGCLSLSWGLEFDPGTHMKTHTTWVLTPYIHVLYHVLPSFMTNWTTSKISNACKKINVKVMARPEEGLHRAEFIESFYFFFFSMWPHWINLLSLLFIIVCLIDLLRAATEPDLF